MTHEIKVRDLGVEDLDAVAEAHERSFPESALGHLGHEAVVRYYRWQLIGPHDVDALAAVDDHDHLLGYLVGGRFRGSTVGFVKGNAPFLVGRVLRHPSVLGGAGGVRAARTGLRLLVRRGGQTRPEDLARVPDGSFGVLVVAVIDGAHRQGIGSALLDEAERRARTGGYQRLHLTLRPDNEEALRFYRSRGWTRLGLPGDTDQQWLMGKELGPDPEAGDTSGPDVGT